MTSVVVVEGDRENGADLCFGLHSSSYVVHVGDYIYEGGTGGESINRTHSGGKELASVYDYRARYAQYRTDVSLARYHDRFQLKCSSLELISCASLS